MPCLVHNRLVKELTLVLVDGNVRATLHHVEVGLPATRQLEVLLCRWECFGLTFLHRHPCFRHHFLNVLVSLLGKTFEILDFGVPTASNVGDPGQFITLIRIFDAEVRRLHLRLLVEVLTEELVEPVVAFARRHVEAWVPLGRCLISIHMVTLLHLLTHRFRAPFHLVLHHIGHLLHVLGLVLRHVDILVVSLVFLVLDKVRVGQRGEADVVILSSFLLHRLTQVLYRLLILCGGGLGDHIS